MRKSRWLLASTTLGLCCGAALAQETINFSYDPLGRLTGSTITGGPNTGRVTGTCFDPAGNRTRYDVKSPTPTPTPTPCPTPTSSP